MTPPVPAPTRRARGRRHPRADDRGARADRRRRRRRPGGLAGSDLYLNPYSTTLEAAQSLSGQARADAQLLGSIPSADWITKGTPAEAQAAVDEIVDAAIRRGRDARDRRLQPAVPRLRAVLRGRCGRHRGLRRLDRRRRGRASATARRPSSSSRTGSGSSPGTRPSTATPSGASPPSSTRRPRPSDRFAQLNYAVDALKARRRAPPSTSTAPARAGSASATSPTACSRAASSARTASSSTPRTTSSPSNSTYFGTWVSSCIAFVTETAAGSFGECGNQYWNGGPGDQLDRAPRCRSTASGRRRRGPALNTSGVDSRYDRPRRTSSRRRTS